MLYQFEYNLGEKDYLDFNVFHNVKASENGSKKSIIIFFSAILVVFSLLFIRNHGLNVATFIAIVIFMVIITLFFLLLTFLVKITRLNNTFTVLILKWQIKSIKKTGKLPFGKENTLRFFEDFMMSIEDGTETKMKYTNIEKVAAGDNAIYIYFSAMQAFIIPFSVFSNEQERNEFYAFINQKRQ